MVDTNIDIDNVRNVLTRIAVCVLNNLNNIPSGESTVKEVIELLKDSPVETYIEIFQKVYDFFLKEGRFQDPVALEAMYPNFFYEIEKIEYSNDIIITFIEELRKIKKYHNIKKALEEGNLQEIENLITKDVKVKNNGETISIDTIMDKYDALERSPSGFDTGVMQLDYYLQGMDYGTLNVIAAPVSSFKTTLAISIAYNACFNQGKKVIYFTLEVTPAKVMFDLIARHAYEMGYLISAQSIKKGKLTPEEKLIFQNAVEDWKNNCKGQIEIIGTENLKEYSYAYLESYIRAKSDSMGGLDLLCLDYLNLLKNKIPASLKLDQYQALNQYTQFFTDLSIRLNFILLILCQVNREGTAKLDKQAEKEGGKKLASTTFFAEANEVERSASTAMILHATRAMKNEGNLDIFLVKNRDGECPENPISTKVYPQYFKVGEHSGIINSLDDTLLISSPEDIKNQLGNFGVVESTNDFSTAPDKELDSILSEIENEG